MTRWQHCILILGCTLVAGITGGYAGEWLQVHVGLEKPIAYMVAGTAGWVGATLLEVWVDFLRSR